MLASEKTWKQVRKDILREKYKNGEVLTEKELSEKMGFSRTPVREALRKLESEELVAKNLNEGWTVKGITEQDMIEVLHIRKCCEKYVVERATKNLDPEREAELRMSIRLMNEFVEKENMDKAKKWFDKFNEVLVETSGVKRIRNILNRIYGYINYVVRESIDYKRALDSCNEHEKIAEAVIEGNVEEAKMLVDQHIQNVQDKLLNERREEDGK